MSSDKRGLFSRIKRSISSAMSDAVEAVSDPGQEIALMLDDLADSIKKAESDLKQGMVDRKVMERKLEKLRADVTAWQARAEGALKLGDETLARAALERKTELSQQVKDAERDILEQTKYVEQLAVDIKQSKKKLKSLNLRRGSLMAQARAAKRDGGSQDFGAGDASNRMDEIEAKISAIEALNEVTAELEGMDAEAVALDAELARLDRDTGVDDELAALKAKMNRALPAGESGESND
jgi:phage shock protein A